MVIGIPVEIQVRVCRFPVHFDLERTVVLEDNQCIIEGRLSSFFLLDADMGGGGTQWDLDWSMNPLMKHTGRTV